MLLIGTTTFRRHDPALLQQRDHLEECTPEEFWWVISCDSRPSLEWCLDNSFLLRIRDREPVILGKPKRLGVMRNKNRILSYFLAHKHFDHLCLLEDDVFPIKSGWAGFYRHAHEMSKSHCLLFLPPDMYGKQEWSRAYEDVVLVGYKFDGGMLLSLTRRAVENAGGMHPEFKIYGGEHSEYVRRLRRMGLMPYARCAPFGCEEWLDGWDYAVKQNRFEKIDRTPWTPHVEQMKPSRLKDHAQEGLQIYERVKDGPAKFYDPGPWS